MSKMDEFHSATDHAAKSIYWRLLFTAWLIACVSTLGALFFSEVMLRTPCVLCWYQRIFMFPLAIILGIAVFAEDRRGALYALPFAVGGVTLAGYHTALVAGWVPQWWIPCGSGPSCSQQALVIFDDIQLPWLSLAAFVAITLTLTLYLQRTRT